MSELLSKHLLVDLETANPKKRIKEVRQEEKSRPNLPSLPIGVLGAAGTLGGLAAAQQQALAQSAFQQQFPMGQLQPGSFLESLIGRRPG